MQIQALTIAHITSENTLREFPLVIATVAKVSRKRGLWLVVRVNTEKTHRLTARNFHSGLIRRCVFSLYDPELFTFFGPP